MPNSLQQTLALLSKDAVLEWRTKERLTPTVFFVLLMLLVFNFAFEIGGAALIEIGPGVLWATYVFSSLFGLNQTFSIERENNSLDAVLLATATPTSLYLSKVLGNLLFLLIVQIVSLIFFAVFFNLTLGSQLLYLVPILLMGSAGLSAIGTLFAAMSYNSRLREFMMPLLLLPVIVPLVISCVEGTKSVFEQTGLGELNYLGNEWWPHLQLLSVYTIVFTTLSIMLFEYVVEES